MTVQWFERAESLYFADVTLQQVVQAWIEHVVVTQKMVAERGGVKEATISNIANGVVLDPHWSTVVGLAKGFGVSVDVFLAGPPHPETGMTRDDSDGKVPPSAVLEQVVVGGTANSRSLVEDVERAVHILTSALERESGRHSNQRTATDAGR